MCRHLSLRGYALLREKTRRSEGAHLTKMQPHYRLYDTDKKKYSHVIGGKFLTRKDARDLGMSLK